MMLVTAIVMHFAVIYICCHFGRRQEYDCVASYCNCNALPVIWNCCRFGRRQEYVCVSCYSNCNALRCDIELLPVWTAAGIRLCCFLLQL